MVPHGKAAHKTGQDHLADEPALRRCFVTRLPRWVAKTRWIKRQPSPRTIYSFPPEIYSGHNSNGTEKKELLWISRWRMVKICNAFD